MRGVLGLAIAAVLTLSACGADTASDSEPAADPSVSTTPSPSGSVSTPPSDPQPEGVVAGRVVRGGSGPCYGVETDDGTLYAVHSPATGDLAVGTTVLVKTGPPPPGMDCGPGERVSALSVEIVGG